MKEKTMPELYGKIDKILIVAVIFLFITVGTLIGNET